MELDAAGSCRRPWFTGRGHTSSARQPGDGGPRNKARRDTGTKNTALAHEASTTRNRHERGHMRAIDVYPRACILGRSCPSSFSRAGPCPTVCVRRKQGTHVTLDAGRRRPPGVRKLGDAVNIEYGGTQRANQRGTARCLIPGLNAPAQGRVDESMQGGRQSPRPLLS